MITTTTFSIEGKTIKEYKGIVFGETISGANLFRDMAASLRDVFGGRAKAYENALASARQSAIEEMCYSARNKGANAVVGVSIAYESLGEGGHGMLMVTATGTAVVVDAISTNQTQQPKATPKKTQSETQTEKTQPTSVVIDRTKEYINCPVCSCFQKSDRNVCERCGVAFVDSAGETYGKITCSVCGKEQSSDRRICWNCSAKLG